MIGENRFSKVSLGTRKIMKIENEWFRTGLVIGGGSCFMLALSTIYIYKEFKDLGYVPMRFYIIVPICLFFLCMVTYCAEGKAWKTISKLSLYTFLFIILVVILYGVKVVAAIVFGEPTRGTLYQGIFALCIGSGVFWVIFKLINSKWLN